MGRQQLLIAIAAVALVIALFSLPKVLLNKEEKELENSVELDKKNPVLPQEKETHGFVAFSELEKKKIGNWKTALATTKPNQSLPLLDSLSILYNNKSLYDSSAYFYEKFLGNQSNVDTWLAIGDAAYKAYYFAADDEKVAKWALKTQEFYQKALSKDPSLLDVKARMAMTYTKGANPMKAVMTLREVLAENPNNEQALLNIGLLSVQSGQHEKAIERFKKLLSINPNNWLATFYLGISYAETGKKSLAKECFEKVKKNEKQAQIKEAAEEYLKQLSVNN